jgi:hypothetical protein
MSLSLSGKRIWQVAAGDGDRSYADLCLNWEVVLNGPGAVGPWPDCRERLASQATARKVTDIARFFDAMRDGDIVVLRFGTSDIYGVGQVVGDEPVWSDAFDDVDGWDLQFVRRVRWFWRCDRHGVEGKPKRFPTYTLKLGDTVQEMTSPTVREWIAAVCQESQPPDGRELVALPDDATIRPLDPSQVGEYLFDHGVAAHSIAALTAQMDDLVRIAKWYGRSSLEPSEHETVAYLVVPLLRALGWTPQKMAVEWNRVDVALFESLPRQDSNLTVCVEAKRLHQSCLTAAGQAAEYAKAPGRGKCQRLIVTDGTRYGVHVRDDQRGGFSTYPAAYLNLTQMRPAYPIYGSGGAMEALRLMAPDWQPGAPPDERRPTEETYPR